MIAYAALAVLQLIQAVLDCFAPPVACRLVIILVHPNCQHCIKNTNNDGGDGLDFIGFDYMRQRIYCRVEQHAKIVEVDHIHGKGYVT